MKTIRTMWECLSLRLKLPAIFLLLLMAAEIYSSWMAYHNAIDDFMRMTDGKLRICAAAVDAAIPPEFHDRARTADAVMPEEEARNRGLLASVADEAKLSYLYSLAEIDGRIRVTASNRVPYFTPYDDQWEALRLTLADGLTRFNTGSDSFGVSRSIITRRVSPDGRIYCIGADLPVPEMERELERHLRSIAATAAISIALVGVVGYVMAMSVTRPLKWLANFARVAGRDGFTSAGRLNADLLPISENPVDEVRLLAKSFDDMQTELAGYLRRLEETVAAKERAEGEMRVAGNIQQGLLPAKPIASPAFAVQGSMTPAKSAGGDLFDYFLLNDRRLCFAIGDVSGKGMPAAMFMSASLTLFRAYGEELAGLADPGEFLAETLRRLDSSLAKHNDAMLFVTMLIGVLECETGMATLISGGHNPPLLSSRAGGAGYVDLPVGGLIGVGLEAEFRAASLRLAPGDSLFLYTDGVTEARSGENAFFGEDRLRELLALNAELEPDAMVATVRDAVLDFSRGEEPADDITALAIRWRG